MRHAQDLLGAVDIHPRSRGAASGKPIVVEDKKNPGQSIDLSSIPLFKPSTKTDFEALSEALVPLLRESATRPHYSLWISNFVKSIVQDLPSADIKKVGSAVTALSNEKMKEEKQQDKGGKKSKAAKTKTTLAAGRDMGRGLADTTVYDEDGLDDGDFM
jgi:translation initiation factor 3 subunit J